MQRSGAKNLIVTDIIEENEMFKDESEFKKIIARLNIDTEPNPAHRETLRRQMLSVFNETAQQSQKRTTPLGVLRRTIMKSPITKLAAAAVIIAAIMLGMYALTGSVEVTSITMAQVRQAMQRIDWMQIINKGGNENEPRIQSPHIDWYSFDSKVQVSIAMRRIVYIDFKTRKQLWWNPAGKNIYEQTIEQTREFADGAAGPFEMIDKTFRIIQAEHNSEIVKELGTYEGQKVDVWTIIRDVKNLPGATRTLTVYIDVDRKLPVAATYDHTQEDGTVLRESNIEFKYPETGPADIYEAGAPRSAQVKPESNP